MSRRPSPHALTHALAMASLLLAPATGWAAPGPQAGVSAAVRGSVLMGEAGHPDVVGRAVADGDAVYLGNAIKAGPAAGMQLMLLDQTTVTLGENAELAVDEFIYDPAQNTGQISMNLTKGAFRLVTGGVSDINPANTKVKTPTATIGIRGTIVLANVSAQGTLIALGGPGPNANSRDRVGAIDVSTPQGSVSLTRPGFATFVAPGQAPEEPRPLTPEESASLAGGLAGNGRSSSEGGSTSEAGATQATEASGAPVAETQADASLTSRQTSSATSADDQSEDNAQSSEYGNEGAQLTSNQLVQEYSPAPQDNPPPQFPPIQLSWAEALQANLGPAYAIARAADLAGLSGTATYTKLGAPLYDISSLDDEARSRLWLTADFSGLTQVGQYDFSAMIDFALRRAYGNWTGIKLPGDDSYYTLAADTGDDLPALLAYDEHEQPVFRVEEETNVPTSYLAHVRGAFISSTSDPNAAPVAVIQGLGIYKRNDSSKGPLYGGGAKVAKDAVPPIDPPLEPLRWNPATENWLWLDTTWFRMNGPTGDLVNTTGASLATLTVGTTVFDQTGISLSYTLPDAALGTPIPSDSRYDFHASIDFATREFIATASNLVIEGTPYAGSLRYDFSLIFLGRTINNTRFGLAQSKELWGPPNARSYIAINLLDSPTQVGSTIGTELYVMTETRLYHGGAKIAGVYTPPVMEDPWLPDIVDTDFAFLPNLEGGEYGQSNWTDLAGISNGTTLFSASNIPLDYKDAAGDPWTVGSNSRFDFSGTIDFTARSFEYGLNNVVLSGINYGSSDSRTITFNDTGTATDVTKNFAWRIGSRSDIVGSEKLSFYNNCSTYPCTIASLLAAELFLATPGRLYRGTSQMTGTYTAAPVIEPPEDPWQAEITEADFTFVPDLEGGEFGQSQWADLTTISNGSTQFSATNIGLDYKDAASDSWTDSGDSRFDFSGTIDFMARSFDYSLSNVVLNGTNYGSGTSQHLYFGDRDGTAAHVSKNVNWQIGSRNDIVGSLKLSFYNDYSKSWPTTQASMLALDLFLATPGRLYHGTSQMTGTYTVPAPPAPVVDTFDSSVFAYYLVQEIKSTDDDVNSWSGYSATYTADGVSLEQRASGSNGPWTSGPGSYSFRADVNFDTHSYALSFYNINIGGADRYRYDYSQTLEANTTGINGTDLPLPSGPRNSTLSWEATFMNDYEDNRAIDIAQQLFIATEGTSYRGRSYVARTLLDPTWSDDRLPPVPFPANPYALSENPADTVYVARDVRLTMNGALDGGIYNLDATVSFMNRSITTSVDVALVNGFSASGTSTQDFSGQNVSTDQGIYLSDQAIFAPGSGSEVPGVTLNEVINTNGRPDESELVHSLQVLQGGDTYTGGTTTLARPPRI